MNKNNLSVLLKKPPVVCLAAMFCCALWGSAFPFIKIGYELFKISASDTASQILFAGIRFTFAGMLVIIFGSLLSRRILFPKRENLIQVVSLSLFQTVLQYLFFYIGLAYTSGTKASVLNSTGVFFAVLFSGLIFKQEKFNFQKAAGCVIGFAGTVIVNLSGNSLDVNVSFLGEGFIVLSAMSYAVSSVLIKRYSKSENAVTLSGYQFIIGGVSMIVFSLVLGGSLNLISAKGVVLLFYMAFLSAAAYTLWGILLKYNDVSHVAVFGFMTPVFGCIFSALFLKESINQSVLQIISALILVCLGIIIVNVKRGSGIND